MREAVHQGVGPQTPLTVGSDSAGVAPEVMWATMPSWFGTMSYRGCEGARRLESLKGPRPRFLNTLNPASCWGSHPQTDRGTHRHRRRNGHQHAMTAAGEVCPKSGPFTTDSGLAFTDRDPTPASPAPIPSTTPPTTERPTASQHWAPSPSATPSPTFSRWPDGTDWPPRRTPR
jgi:hypothetical protein